MRVLIMEPNIEARLSIGTDACLLDLSRLPGL